MGRHGEARREQLVEAAFAALSARGIQNLRVRDIADQAGVATGTVHYHFADMDELLVAVHELAVDRFAEARRQLLAGLVDARDKVRALVDTGVPSSPDDEMVVALYELLPVIRQSRLHQAHVRGLYEQQVALYAGAFEIGVHQGHFSPEAPVYDLAANAVALEDAFGLHIVSRNTAVTPDRARALLTTHLADALRCPSLNSPVSPIEETQP